MINTPFSRDPNNPVRCPPEETNQCKASTNFQSNKNNHSFAKPFPVHNYNSVSKKNNIILSGRLKLYINLTESVKNLILQ